MIALRVLGIASAIMFIASAVVAQTAITRERPLIANPTITTKPIAKPLVASPTVKPGRIRADDADSHSSSPGQTIKGSFGENSAWQKTGTRAAGHLNTVNPADVKMNTMKPGMQQQGAPSMQRGQ
jgi:hypothetical protein